MDWDEELAECALGKLRKSYLFLRIAAPDALGNKSTTPLMSLAVSGAGNKERDPEEGSNRLGPAHNTGTAVSGTAAR